MKTFAREAGILVTDTIFQRISSCSTQYIDRPRGEEDRLRRKYTMSTKYGVTKRCIWRAASAQRTP